MCRDGGETRTRLLNHYEKAMDEVATDSKKMSLKVTAQEVIIEPEISQEVVLADDFYYDANDYTDKPDLWQAESSQMELQYLQS